MRAVSGIHTSSTFQPSVLRGPCPYGEKATGITAQVRAGPARRSTEAVNEKPAKSQPTPGKPSSAIGSSYPASAAGLRPRTRRGIRPVNASGASMIAFAPASRCRAVIRQALIAYEEKPASTASAAGTRTSAAQGSSLATASWKVAPRATS